MKKVLFLGGSVWQVPAIQYARTQGYYVILCDYLPDNPGQHYAHKYYEVSTTDQEAVLQVAVKENIDAIVAYGSDPAALTAAYVGYKLDLPTNPYESILVLSRKDLFRRFLEENGFNYPRSISFTNKEEIEYGLQDFNFPLILKPVDSSGSKGVCKIGSLEEAMECFDYAMSFSRAKRVLFEEFIEMGHECILAGDAFVYNGKVMFYGFLNSHRENGCNPFIPVGSSYPVFLGEEKLAVAREELQRVFDILQIKSGMFNFDLMFDRAGKFYIIEIGPRNGGNMIPELIEEAMGFDSLKVTFDCALGNDILEVQSRPREVFISTYLIHSSQKGLLQNIILSEQLEKKIIKKNMFKETGDPVEPFKGANNAIGIIFLQYDSLAELKEYMANMHQHIRVELLGDEPGGGYKN